ncbi:conserved Plasmodium protein, unknown function [Plasmodium gaboni]|uniref:Uncharacterized protein n=1 Tax=Plasmodium gaboni TaxID=647221 RepID=A0ABY0KWI3_9APIC|nr:conserved Plasmodium protein, unknown function [Plasmodium gaboni]
MDFNNIYYYVTLLTSCMNISKLKMEKNENIESYINHLNVIKMTNKNEYSFDSTNFSNMSKQNIKDKKYLNDIMYSSLIYNDNNFYHYFNIYEHFEYKEESHKKKTINITMPYKRKNNNNDDNDHLDHTNEEKKKKQQNENKMIIII